MESYVICCALLLPIIFTDASFQTDLLHKMFDKYEGDVIPFCEGASSRVTVTIDVALRQIVELDEPMQVIKLNIWVRMGWKDCRLTWTESDYGNISHIVVPVSRVWKPDITLYDSVTKEGNDKEFSADIFSDGTISHNLPLLIENRCKVNVRYFPFDKQTCKLMFGSWAHNGNEIDVISRNLIGDLTSMVEHVEWEVLQFLAERHELNHTCCSGPFPDVTFYLDLKRKPNFYIYNILLPCILISSIGVLGFILPAESGEKVAVGITVLLSQAVFLLLVGDKLPPSSETLPLIAVYFDFCMFLVCFSCVVSVVILNLHYRTNSKVPRWAKTLFLKNCARKDDHRQSTIENKANPEYDLGKIDQPSICDFLESPKLRMKSVFHHDDLDAVKTIRHQYGVNNKEDAPTQTQYLKEDNKSDEAEWQKLAMVLDRIGMIIYIVAFSVGSVIYVLISL